MKKNNNEKYKIDSIIIKKYLNSLNSIIEPMSKVKEKINEPIYINIKNLKEEIKKLYITYPKEQANIHISIIKQIMNQNNGIISSRMIEPLNISKQYLSILKKKNDIEKVARGIYQLPNVFEDSFYSFQTKYKKVIFSHMNALYFHKMTEEVPYNYTVTVSQSYHMDIVNEKCNVFYVSNDILELGLCEVETPNGNKVKTYDIERCICDIIRSKNRMDIEQVKKTIKKYMESKDKNLIKLMDYSKKMNINKKIIEILEAYNY